MNGEACTEADKKRVSLSRGQTKDKKAQFPFSSPISPTKCCYCFSFFLGGGVRSVLCPGIWAGGLIQSTNVVVCQLWREEEEEGQKADIG